MVAENIYKENKKDALEELLQKNNRISCVKDESVYKFHIIENKVVPRNLASLDRALFFVKGGI